MRTVYQTSFCSVTKQCTGPSVPLGRVSLDSLQALYGEPVRRSRRWLIYDGICFGPVVMMVDGTVKPVDTAGINRSNMQ